MPAFLDEIDLSAQPAYPANPQVDLKFRPDEYALMLESTDTDAYASFNGVTDHIWLKNGTPFSTQTYESVERKVWLRSGALGPSGVVKVAVEANTDT